KNVSDGFFHTGSVGAIAVAGSDPNVVYVGMGEHAVRGVATSHGDGVYKSTDAGKTWKQMGLLKSRQISRIRIHPQDPEWVYVAVQGAVYGDSEERGIYRSKDGGKSWEKVLYVSERAGASDLAMDMSNPRILYAAFWDHHRWPWKVESGGPGSGIWKSTDGGDSWEKIDSGLPQLLGKIGVDVSRSNPDRVYAIIEAEAGEGGLYRSDNAGETWKQVNSERIIQTRSWYYMEVFADPQDEDTVYVLNAPMMRSVDGGRTFTQIRVPHGDNHDMWINPTNHKIMIESNDGGANISFNGGKTWSTERNQPTAQFYRVITDHQFPYRVYGGQQDNSTVSIASAAIGGIGWKDWYPVAGGESAYLAFDPDDPRYVIGTSIEGDIDIWDAETREVKPIRPYPELNLGVNPTDQRYRFDWNNPVVASPHDPDVYYQAGNVLFKTQDRGQSWEVISPDLTYNDPEKLGPGGGPITNEAAGGEVYNIIFYVVESPHEAGTIWAGTNDGLVQLTRNGGASWQNVTPEGLGEGMINAIEVSPHDPATAYITFTRYKFNDFTPHIYKSNDYGKSWVQIVDGIEDEAWVRVVREDPERRGLLYAGTELGIYISFDDGGQWQKWQLDLPVVPVTDLTIQDDDLVASTQGRAFWILDDLSPVRQLTPEIAAADIHLFEPQEAVLAVWETRFGGGSGARTGENPPSGTLIYYSLEKEQLEGLVTVEILDEAGELIRTYATDPEKAGNDKATKIDKPKAGLNRLVWDFRHQQITTVPDLFTFGVPEGGLPGRMVPPGTYRVRLTVGSHSVSHALRVVPDPRREATLAQYQDQDRFLAAATELVEQIHQSVNRMRAVRDQVTALVERTKDHARAEEIRSAGDELVQKINDWEENQVQPRQQTFQDVINFTNKLNAQVLALMQSVNGTEPPVTQGARERLSDLQAEWADHRGTMDSLLANGVTAFNRLIEEIGIPPVIVPGR
ncbi:MAG: glycosyl hydrolase, partial [Acidobacteriota bacterium]